MTKLEQTQDKLLNDQRVVDEINRHLWVESEKAGYDIGFDAAKKDWLKRFSRAWMEYHMSDELLNLRKRDIQSIGNKTVRKNKTSGSKRRSAKSYIK